MPNDRIMVFIPMYNCEKQIPRVLAQLAAHGAGLVDEVMVVDNGSRDASIEMAMTAAAALPVTVRVFKNCDNYNLGGSHKVAFDRAIDHGFTHVIVLHGDDQADFADFAPLLRAGSHRECDALLGSRFAKGARRVGYAAHRVLGNRVFNLMFSTVAGRWLSDLGSGLNCFSTAVLTDRFYRGLVDDLTFNNYFLLSMVVRRWRYRFVPISWREEDQVSNVRLFRQAWRTLGIVFGFGLGGRTWLERPRHGFPLTGYTSEMVYEHIPNNS